MGSRERAWIFKAALRQKEKREERERDRVEKERERCHSLE